RFRFLYTFGDTDVYENLRALPRAFVVPSSGVEVIPDDAAQLLRVKDPEFDPERCVVLAENLPERAVLTPAGLPAGPTTIAWKSTRTNDFELEVSTGQPGILVVSQAHYPGWKA